MKLFIFLSLVLSFHLFAGERGGNGGGVHVCGDKVELYDFYEGKHPLMHKLKLWELPPDPVFDRMVYGILAMNHLKQDLPANIYALVEAEYEKLRRIPENELVISQSIPFIPDADIPMVDEGCSYQQVANWNDRFERVFFRKSLFNKLDPMGQAGLYIHETLYKVSRDALVAKNSDKIRKVVAKVFSDEKLTKEDIAAIWDGEPMAKRKQAECEASLNFLITAFDSIEKTVRLCEQTRVVERLHLSMKEQSRKSADAYIKYLNVCMKVCTEPKQVEMCGMLSGVGMPICL